MNGRPITTIAEDLVEEDDSEEASSASSSEDKTSGRIRRSRSGPSHPEPTRPAHVLRTVLYCVTYIVKLAVSPS